MYIEQLSFTLSNVTQLTNTAVQSSAVQCSQHCLVKSSAGQMRKVQYSAGKYRKYTALKLSSVQCRAVGKSDSNWRREEGIEMYHLTAQSRAVEGNTVRWSVV